MEGTVEEVHLRDYLWIMFKRRWTIAAFFTVVVAAVIVFTYTMTPIYRATTQILIEKENPNIVDFKELYTVDATTQDFYQTQYKILESRFLVKRVIDKLDLRNNEEFNPHSEEETEERKADKDEAIVNNFLSRLKVEPIRNTRLVKIHFESVDPALAAKVANTIVAAYIEHNLESKIESIHGASEFLSRKIQEQRKKLEESELLLQRYKEKYNILSLKEKENITVSRLFELNTNVLQAKNARVEAETRYKQVKDFLGDADMIESIPQVVANPFIRQLKTDEANLSKEFSEISKKFGTKHPRIITIKEELRTIRDKISTEIKKVVNFLKNEFEVALVKEETLKKAFEELKAESQQLNKDAITYGVLLREVESNRQMHDILLTRLKETSITGGIQSTNARVIDRAEIPGRPVKPKKKLNILLSIIIGIFGGTGIAFFLEYLDNTVKIPDDLKRYIKIPYLGPVLSFKKDMGNDSEEEKVLVTFNSPKSSAAESYRGLRTAIVFSSSDTDKKTLLVTSSGPSEGKTLTVSNLAVAMAQSNVKTLLVDADLRKPRIHNIFGFSKDPGFSNLLIGKARLEDVIRKTDIPNLDVIPCGHIPPNPAELLGSESMKNIIEMLKERYDKILLDSAPLLPITDSVVTSAFIDEILLVIQAGKTSRGMINRAVEQLRDVRANLIGAVLNNIKVSEEGYYYQYYYYYYGDKEPKKKRRGHREDSLS